MSFSQVEAAPKFKETTYFLTKCTQAFANLTLFDFVD